MRQMLCLVSESVYGYRCVSVGYALHISVSPSLVSPSIPLFRSFPMHGHNPRGDIFYSLINFTLDY